MKNGLIFFYYQWSKNLLKFQREKEVYQEVMNLSSKYLCHVASPLGCIPPFHIMTRINVIEQI